MTLTRKEINRVTGTMDQEMDFALRRYLIFFINSEMPRSGLFVLWI